MKIQGFITKLKLLIYPINNFIACIMNKYFKIVIFLFVFLLGCNNKNVLKKDSNSINLLFDSILMPLPEFKIYSNFDMEFTFDSFPSGIFEYSNFYVEKIKNDYQKYIDKNLIDYLNDQNKKLISCELPKSHYRLYLISPPFYNENDDVLFTIKYIQRENNKYFWWYEIIIYHITNDSIIFVDAISSEKKIINLNKKWDNKIEFDESGYILYNIY